MNFPNPSDVSKAVASFNSRFGPMDTALWKLSMRTRAALTKGESLDAQVLVWAIRCWWGVQGVTRDTARLAGEAISRQRFESHHFHDSLTSTESADRASAAFVTQTLTAMREMGAPRTEFSLVSKAMHWLMPWRLPAYDSFVRRSLAISSSTSPVDAHRAIMEWQRRAAGRLLESGGSWMGEIEPRAPFRALDKYLWYMGGGSDGNSVVVKSPDYWIQKETMMFELEQKQRGGGAES